MAKVKVIPCKVCGGEDIELRDCGYNTTHMGGGTCQSCGRTVRDTVRMYPSPLDLARIWNNNQKPGTEDKLKSERAKTRKLRKQIRDLRATPVA